MTRSRLELVGFTPVTTWELRKGRIKPVSLVGMQSGCLYAFVVNGEVKYIGETSRHLRDRLEEYSYRKSVPEDQPERIRKLIRVELDTGHTVEIQHRIIKNTTERRREEDRLIRKFNRLWNRT